MVGRRNLANDPETITEITAETTTPLNAEPAAAPEPDRGGGELIFDFKLTPLSAEERERARETLHGLSPDLAQQVLDEWNHAHACQSIRQSRWGWLRKVADIARSGQFTPSADLAEQRRAQQQRPAAVSGDPPSRRQPGLAGAAGSNPQSVPGRGMLALHRPAAWSGAGRNFVAGSAESDGGGLGGGALAAHHRNPTAVYGFAGADTGWLIWLSKSGFKGRQRRFKTIYRCSYCCSEV